MPSRALNDLAHPCYVRAEAHLLACERAGISLLIYCTYRSVAEQAALHAQSRESLERVNSLRANVGLPPITAAENRISVTDAAPGQSLHNYRLAYDCVVLQAGKPIWNGTASIWHTAGLLGESVGLEWARRWTGRLREDGHFQYAGGLTIQELAAGKLPG